MGQAAVFEVLEIIERLHAHEDGIEVLPEKEYWYLCWRLKKLIAEAFPDHAEQAPEIAKALAGEAPPPLLPLWWEGGWWASTPSPEDLLLSSVLGQRDPRYLPEETIEPLGTLFQQHLDESDCPFPGSYPLFVVVELVRCLLWGFLHWRAVRGKRLVSLAELLRGRFGASDETIEGLRRLAHVYRNLPDGELLREFFAVPGVTGILDDLLVLYGDVVAAKEGDSTRGDAQRAGRVVSFPRTPVPERDTAMFRRRLVQTYRSYRNSRAVAKAFRIRKSLALELLRELREEHGDAEAECEAA
jgi:hypothetical protein